MAMIAHHGGGLAEGDAALMVPDPVHPDNPRTHNLPSDVRSKTTRSQPNAATISPAAVTSIARTPLGRSIRSI